MVEAQVTIPQKRDWHVRSVLLLIILLGLLVGSSSTMYAGCQGAAGISPEEITTLRNLLSPATAPGDFHVYAETTSADRQAHFVLYSITNATDPSAQTVYLAAIGPESQENILSAVDVTVYLPPFARAVPSQSDASFLSAPRTAG